MRNYAEQAIVDKNYFLLIDLFLCTAAKLILLTWYAAYFFTWGFCKCSKTYVYNSEEENEAPKHISETRIRHSIFDTFLN